METMLCEFKNSENFSMNYMRKYRLLARNRAKARVKLKETQRKRMNSIRRKSEQGENGSK